MKNPLCRTGNLSLSGHVDGEDWGAVNEEYCHAHSEHLRNPAERLEKQWQESATHSGIHAFREP